MLWADVLQHSDKAWGVQLVNGGLQSRHVQGVSRRVKGHQGTCSAAVVCANIEPADISMAISDIYAQQQKGFRNMQENLRSKTQPYTLHGELLPCGNCLAWRTWLL